MKLKCPACGTEAWTYHPEPHFGVDLARTALDIHWLAVRNLASIVIFCADKCYRANISKRGTLRRRMVNPWLNREAS